MSAGPSLYRRHRPRTFADVVGQEHVVRTLRNAVAQSSVHHAYLFVGSRGTGKTSMAKILAACLNCQQGPTVEPCGVCESCVAIANATSLDVIEMDAASNNSVDDIRELRESVQFAPVSGRSKVYILDEAHMLSPQAWNAFLKTLEEPPPNTIFVLATTEAQKVLPTVVDRCHRFDFGRPTVAQLTAVVGRVAAAEAIDITPDAVALLARQATGSFRDALGTLEQLVTYSGKAEAEPASGGHRPPASPAVPAASGTRRITVDDVLAVLGVADADLLFGVVDAIAAHDAGAALRAAGEVAASGRDLTQFAKDLEEHARDLLVVQTLDEVPPELRVTPERDARLADQAARVPGSDVVRLLDLLAAALRALKDGASARTQLELALVKAAAPEIDPAARALMARLERVEAALSGAPAPRPAAFVAPAPVASGASDEPATSRPVSASPTEPRGHQPEPTANGTDQAQPSAGRSEPPEPAAARTDEADPAGNRVSTATVAATQAAAAVAVAASVTTEPSFEDLVALWPAVLDAVRGDNEMLVACLAEARPVELRGRELVVAFAESQAFNRKMADSQHNRAVLEAALHDLAGAPLRVTFELREVDQSSAQVEPPSEEELVRRFKDEFDAEEIASDATDDEEGEA